MITTWLTAAFLALSACAAPVPPSAMAAAPIPPYSRDLMATTTSHGCNVLAGTLHDPYTGRVVVGSTRALQIDHALSLSEAWRLGAWRWTPAQREAYANDPFVLVTTIGSVNESKSDKPLSLWLPPHDPCGFARHVDAIGDHYHLVDPSRDAQVARACR